METAQATADGRAQQGNDGPFFVELDFHLRGVDVDVHPGWIHFEEEDVERQSLGREQADETVADGAVQSGMADEAPVHKEELFSAGTAGEGRLAHEAGDRDDVRGFIDGDEALIVARAEEAEDAGAERAGAQVKELCAVRSERESEVRVGQRDAGELVRAVAQLDRVGFQKGPAGGNVEEEVPDCDGGAGGAGRGGDGWRGGAFDEDVGTEVVAGALGPQFDAGDRGDGGERFAPESLGEEREEVVGGAEL